MSVNVIVPQLGESVVEGTISRWLKSVGDAVVIGDVLAELETDKVNIEIAAENSGVLESLLKQEGETVNVGDSIATITEGKAATVATSKPVVPVATEPAVAVSISVESAAPATPVAKALAADNNVDITSIKGSGPGGKVLKDDVAAVIGQPASKPATPVVSATPAPAVENKSVEATTSAPITAGIKPVERVRISRRRQTIMVRLKEAQNTAAMLTTFNEIDMSAVMDVRRRRKDVFKERNGVNLGFMSFFTKAVVGALKAFPMLNAEILETEILVKKYYDIGIAVSTEEGLVVPVLREADNKSFAEIEKAIVDVATRARTGKLTLPELLGGTFTITNGGTFGSLMSTPILNTPQVGILGMHTIQERPVVRDGQIVIRPMMYIALSYDHRIVDGSEAVRFLVRVKELIEDPAALMLEG